MECGEDQYCGWLAQSGVRIGFRVQSSEFRVQSSAFRLLSFEAEAAS